MSNRACSQEMPHFAASHQSLHFLVISPFVTRISGWHKRAKQFVCLFDSLCPGQQFFSYVGTGLPGTPVLSRDQCVFLKDTTQCHHWVSNLQTLILESSTLPLSNCVPYKNSMYRAYRYVIFLTPSILAVTFVICWQPSQTVWTLIRTDRTSVLIWIQTICHSATVPERIFWKKSFEPRHEISNNVVCATSKASDQPVHMRSLIKAFAIRLNIVWLLSYYHLEFLSLTEGCRGLSGTTFVKMPHCWKSHVDVH